MRSASVLAFGDGEVRLSDGSRLAADRLVAATGASLGLAPELARLLPIKGQIVRVEGVSIRSPVIRAEGVYIAPTRGGAMIGATMEPGRADLEVEPAVVAALCHRAFEIAPALREGRATGLAGVRAATPDGLPLVGWSAEPGVLVAAGARRNGWLLAPLMAEEIIAALAGAAGGLYAARLAASRSS